MNRVTTQAVNTLRGHILNQVRFVHPMALNLDPTVMELGAEEITDEEVDQLLGNASFLSDRRLSALAGRIGLNDLYDEDAWVDPVADYIVDNQAECMVVWDEVLRRGTEA